jgi:amidohydrolase
LTKSQRNSYPAFARQSLAYNSSEKTMKPKLITAIILLLVAALIVPAAQQPRALAATATRDQQIAQAAEGLRARLVECRRDFHMHPELSNREERTARVVAERLRALGLDEVKTGVGRHGVVALLKGAKPGPVVAVRTDMDALPVLETMDVPYKSQNPGVKHACGHDVHMTVELGVAEVLSKMRDQISGTIKFIFQPAEEGAPAGEEGGAALMIKEGALENPRPAVIFGLHTNPLIEAGQIAYHSGPAMASSDRISITVRGKKSHGAQPQMGVDAIVVAAECITALQTIHSRRIDPLEPLVITIGTIKGGDRNNIIADEVQMTGTMRAFNEEVRKRAQQLMRDTLQNVTAAYGATFDLKFDGSNPVTYNDPRLVEETLPTLRRIVGDKNLIAPKPFMPAEDFSEYQKIVPGFFYFLGVGNKARGITAAWHTAEFDVDEESLVVGVKVMAGVLLDYLDHHANAK